MKLPRTLQFVLAPADLLRPDWQLCIDGVTAEVLEMLGAPSPAPPVRPQDPGMTIELFPGIPVSDRAAAVPPIAGSSKDVTLARRRCR
ncbi:MAG: hypothetical protein WKF57_19055 [Nakamurella sp.]